MKPTVWTMIKRLPRAIKLYFAIRKMHIKCDRKTRHRIAAGYFKLALVWS